MSIDIPTITAAIGAASAAVGLIDKMADQLESFLTGRQQPSVPNEHRMKIEAVGTDIVAREHGHVLKTITAKDLAKLPSEQLRHISVLEKSMENHYELWAAVYPQRNASVDPIVNAKVNQQLKQIVSNMSDDLDGILSFLESCGMYLDDHYLNIRHLVTHAK